MAQVKVNDPLVDLILKQYEDSKQVKTTPKTKFDLANYFSTFIENKKTESAEKTIRILPSADGGTPIKEIYVHTKLIDGQYKKFICLKHTYGEDCPFCEARAELLASGKEANKELAKKFGSRKMYVLRVIDRDLDDDKVKFWRFNHDYRNQGTFDKLTSLIKSRGNIFHEQTGRDLVINIARDQKRNCIISAIVDQDPSPIHEDPEMIKQYVNDEKTWEDVYAKKSYDYLTLILLDKEPVWDKANECYIAKDELEKNDESESEITMGGDVKEPTIKEPVVVKQPETKVESKSTDEDEEDDLPF